MQRIPESVLTIATVGAIACAISACAGGSSPDQRDGTIRLVEEQTYGRSEGSEEYLLGGVMAAAAAEDGHLVIAEANRLRVFAPDGSFLSYVGTPGEGPGEFMRVISVDVRDDHIVAFDQNRQRIIRYAFDGAFDGSAPFGPSSHAFWMASTDRALIIAATRPDSTGERFAGPFLQMVDDDLRVTESFGSMDLVYDLDDPYQRRLASETLSLNGAGSGNRVAFAPDHHWCRVAVYTLAQSGSRSGLTSDPTLLESDNCENDPVQIITEEQYNVYRELMPDRSDQVPGSLRASFGPDGGTFSLVTRASSGLFYLSDGSLVQFVRNYDDGWHRFAERYAPDGAYVGRYNVEGFPDARWVSFMDKAGDDKVYLYVTLPDGSPTIKRYGVVVE